MNLIIDIGNTTAKIAVFSGNELLEKVSTDSKNIIETIKKLSKKYELVQGIISSVSTYDPSLMKENIRLKKIIVLDRKTRVPFENLYKSPETLGVDRIALASAAVAEYPGKNVLVIDAGTCITYDFVTIEGAYLGGAIAPGIDMRYKALNTFTARLPLLEKGSFELIGTNTASSIHSGILNGVFNEIEGVIEQYKAQYQTLTVVLTGGDTNFLAKMLKSTIFANPNFLLVGLNSILIHKSDG